MMAVDMISLPDALKNLVATIDRLEADGSLAGEGLRAARKEMEALDAYVNWFCAWKTKTAVPEGVEPTPEMVRVTEYQLKEFEIPLRDYIAKLEVQFIRWSEESPGSPSN